LLRKVVRAPGQTGYELETTYTQNELGWITRIESGPATARFVVDHSLDPAGRITASSAAPSAGAQPYVTQYFYDAFQNMAVLRFNNLGHDDQPPKYADGSGAARPWVRHEWRYVFERVVESWMDRRPLPDPDNLSNPTTVPNPWMVHYALLWSDNGLLKEMTLPNGGKLRYTYDGYKTLYKTEAYNGQGWIELGRQYFDSDLLIARRRQLLNDDPVTFGDTLYTRNHGGLGLEQATRQCYRASLGADEAERHR
jgi:YD repeat-containing protein